MPEGITSATVCKKSGKLAVEGLCDADPRGSMVETEYFAEGTVPTEVCDHHVSATICTSSGLLAGEFCPSETKQTSVYIVGGSPESADGPYLLSDGLANSTCNVHTASPSATPATESKKPSKNTNKDNKKPSGSLTPIDTPDDDKDNSAGSDNTDNNNTGNQKEPSQESSIPNNENSND